MEVKILEFRKMIMILKNCIFYRTICKNAFSMIGIISVKLKKEYSCNKQQQISKKNLMLFEICVFISKTKSFQ